MALGSLLLALLAGMTTVLGFVATVIPGVGAALSFSAPVLALVGIILGGTAMSRAAREGKPRDLAKVAVALNVLAFFPALMVATTCGVCSAMLASGPIQVQRSFQVNMRFPQDQDGGLPVINGANNERPTGSPGKLDPPPILDQEADEAKPASASEAEPPPPPLPPGPQGP